jgi:hypothetical protein
MLPFIVFFYLTLKFSLYKITALLLFIITWYTCSYFCFKCKCQTTYLTPLKFEPLKGLWTLSCEEVKGFWGVLKPVNLKRCHIATSVLVLLREIGNYWSVIQESQLGETTWDIVFVDERSRLLTPNPLTLTAVGSNPNRDFGFFHVRKLSS